RHVHVETGFNMRMEGFQGAVLGVKLPYLPGWTNARRQIARRYSEALAGVPGLRLPVERPGAYHNCHIYALCTDRRDDLRSHLAGVGIQTAIHYPTPVHLQPAYRHLGYRQGDFPIAEALCRSQITLPLFPELMDTEVDRVIEDIRQWTNGSANAA